MSKHINSYFTALIAAVNEWGGDTLKFAGDALICMFGGGDSENTSLLQYAMMAVQAAFHIQTKLSVYDASEEGELYCDVNV